jgi:hypothetical protein
MPKSWAVCLFLAIASSRASPWRGRCALIAFRHKLAHIDRSEAALWGQMYHHAMSVGDRHPMCQTPRAELFCSKVKGLCFPPTPSSSALLADF